ncbi:MAG: hypothetical protein AB7G44_06695 [Bacteroidia bacterium]
MKNLVLFVIISAAVLVNSGCASKLMSFEKRRYNKGYHVDFTKNKEQKSNAVASVSDNPENIPQQTTSEIITAPGENTYTTLPELHTSSKFIEETVALASSEKKVKEKNKFFQNPILKHFTGSHIKATAKHSLDKLVIKKNTAGTNQTMQFNFFTFLGALIGGGCLVALAVMLFSNWASVTLLITFVSGCLFGLILLIVGANT